MKKFTTLLLISISIFFFTSINAQYACDNPIVIDNGFTDFNVTTLGDGSQNWNNNPANTCVFGAYFSSDVYLYKYTSSNFENISLSIYSRADYMAAGIYKTCDGESFSDCITGEVLPKDEELTLSFTLEPNETIYIPVGIYVGGLDFDITNFTVEEISCPTPFNLEFLQSTTNSASLQWNKGNSETEWEYVIQEKNSGIPTGSGELTNTSNIEVDNLNSATYYECYVRAKCDINDFSDWIGPVSFATKCKATTNFTEDFEQTEDDQLPICWNKVGNKGTATGTNDFAAGFGSLRCLFLGSSSADNRATVSTQTISNANDGTHQLRYYFRSPVPSQFGQTIELGYLVDPSDANTFVSLVIDTVNSTSPKEQIYVPNNLPNNEITFAFRSGIENKNLRIDNVYWEEIPPCAKVENLTVSNIKTTTADVGWTEKGDATKWDIEYGKKGFVRTGTPVVENISSNPYKLKLLNSGEEYEFYVRSDCGSGDESSWVGPMSFKTLCGKYSLPYTEKFNEFLPTCWTESNDTEIGAINNSNNGDWGLGDFLNQGISTSARFPFSGNGDKDWLITPSLDFSTGSVSLSLTVGVTEFSTTNSINMEDDDEVKLLISEDDGENWTVLKTWGAANTPSNTGDEHSFDLKNHTSPTTKIAFYANEGDTSNYGYYFHLDNLVLNVEAIQPCATPQNIEISNITHNSASVNWNKGDVESSWEFVLQDQNSGTPSGTGTEVNDSTIELTNLVSSNEYEVYLRSKCDTNRFSNWSGPYYFTTLASCEKVDTVSAINITSNSIEISWKNIEMTNSWDLEYGEKGFTPSYVASITDIDTNLYQITGLNPNTAYDVYLQSNCGNSNLSQWAGPFTIATDCEIIEPKYEEFFDSYLPECWNEGANTSIENGPNGIDGIWNASSFLNQSNNQSAKAQVNNNDIKDWLVSPRLNFTKGNFGLSLIAGLTKAGDTISSNLGEDDEVKILISSDDGDTWKEIYKWDNTKSPSSRGDSILLNLTGYNSSTTRIAFWINSGSDLLADYDFFIDNFIVEDYDELISNISETAMVLEYFPNPVENKMYISANTKIVNAKVFNSQGHVLKSFKSNSNHLSLDLSDLDPGYFLMQIISKDKTEVVKFIKQ